MAIDTRGFSLSALPVYNPMDPRLFAVEYPDFGEIAQRGISGYATGMQIKSNKQQQELGALQIQDYTTKLDQQRDAIKKEREATDLFNNKVGSLEGMTDEEAQGLQPEDKAFFDLLKETKALGLAPTPENYQVVALRKAEREAQERLKQIEADAKVQIARLEKGSPYAGQVYSDPNDAAIFYPDYEIEYNEKLRGYIPTKLRIDSDAMLASQGVRYGFAPEAWIALTDEQRNAIILQNKQASGLGLNDKTRELLVTFGIVPSEDGSTEATPKKPEDKTKKAIDRTKNYLIHR